MKGFAKKFMLVMSVFILTLPIFTSEISAATFTQPEIELSASAGMIFDENSGQIVYSKNPDEKLAIGSITKIITLYLVTKAIKDGQISESDLVTPTQEEADMTQDATLANVRLDADKSYSVKDLYNAAWIVSSNSAAMMLAGKVSGSQAKFVRLMRKTVKSWGIKDAQLYNVSGLNNSDLQAGMYLGANDGENMLSANDIGIIVKHVLDEYPEVLQTTSQDKLSFPIDGEVKTYDTLNFLLKGQRDYQEGFEFDGLKTGTTKQAGESFVGTLPYENTRLVTIILDAQGEDSDNDKRFRSTQQLVHYVSDNFERREVIQKNKSIKINNKKYKTYEPVYVWLPKNSNIEDLRYTVSDNDLGFTAVHKKQTVKLLATNTNGGYLPFKKTNIKKRIQTKTNQKSWWDQIVEFFNHLF